MQIVMDCVNCQSNKLLLEELSRVMRIEDGLTSNLSAHLRQNESNRALSVGRTQQTINSLILRVKPCETELTYNSI